MAIESSITTTTSSIKITWTGLSSSTSYLVNNQLYTGSGKTGYVSGKSETISGKTSYSYTFSSLNAGTDYYLYSTLEFSSGGTASSVRDKKVTTTPYYLTIKAGGDGIDYFTFNGTKYNSGDTLPYKNGQSITMKAVLKSNATFSKWTTSPTSLSTVHNKTSTSITFNMPAYDVTITGTANLPKKYYLTLAKAGSGVSNFTVNSKTFSSGDRLEYNEGQTINVTANMSSNYSFVEWTSTASGIVTSSNKKNKTISFDMPSTNFTLTAKGEKTVVKYDVKTSYYTETPNKEGTYGNPYNTETRTYTEGDSVTLNNLIYSSDTHNFSYATINGTKYTSTSTSFTVNQDCTVKIYYVPKSYNLKLTGEDGVSSFSVKKGDSSAVSVTAGNTTSVKHGWTVQITAKIDDGYKFWYWWQTQTNGPLTSNSYDNPLTFTMPAFAYQLNAVGQTATYTAQAFRTNYTSAISEVSPSNAVSVSSGTSQSFSATVNYGYIFSGWYSSTSTTTTESLRNPYSVSITKNTKLYARAEAATLSFSDKTTSSFVVKLNPTYNYPGTYDYRINVFKVNSNGTSTAVLNGQKITYANITDGYKVSGLDEGSTYAVNIAYSTDSETTFNWIWASGTAPTVTTATLKTYNVTFKYYTEQANQQGEYGSAYNTETYPYKEGTTITLSDRIYTPSDGYEHSHTTVDGVTTETSFVVSKAHEVKIYYQPKSYDFKVTAATGIQSTFSVKKGNSAAISVSSGSSTKVKYGWTVQVTATPNSSYDFWYWYCNPSGIVAESDIYSNPVSFTMPKQTFSIQAVATEKTATVSAEIYTQSYDSGQYSWTTTFTKNTTIGSTINLATWANECLTSLQNEYKDVLDYFNYLEYAKTTDVDEKTITTLTVANSTETVYMFFDVKQYTLTITNGTGIKSVTVNGEAPKTKYRYQQPLTLEAILNDDYIFSYWYANPSDGPIDSSKIYNNPVTFNMPDYTYKLQPQGVYQLAKYDIKVQAAYQSIADNDVYSYETKIDTQYDKGTSLPLSTYKTNYAKTGFTWSKTTINGTSTTSSSITVSQDATIIIYYTRNTYSLTVDGDSGVSGIYVNNHWRNKGETISPYKFEQEITLVPVFLDGYSFNRWESSEISGLTEENETIYIPAKNSTVKVYSQSSLPEWKWTDDENKAFSGRGLFSTLTATRWNAFLTWCNKVIQKNNGTQINEDFFGISGEPLYASHFQAIINCLDTVITLPSEVPSSYKKGDIVKGIYFIKLAEAMNKIR